MWISCFFIGNACIDCCIKITTLSTTFSESKPHERCDVTLFSIQSEFDMVCNGGFSSSQISLRNRQISRNGYAMGCCGGKVGEVVFEVFIFLYPLI